MDFGDILDDWDRKTAKPVGKKAIRADEREHNEVTERALLEKEYPSAPSDAREAKVAALPKAVDPLTAWLRVNGVQDKDAEAEEEGISAAERRRALRAKAPDARLDLHGLNREEAWLRLASFFAAVRQQGAEKVLVVHGKGNHSEGEAVLKRTTREFVERCPFAGEFGQADSRSGGAGATWVILKEDGSK
jgi:DNA-nicking Smr family endonuclease